MKYTFLTLLIFSFPFTSFAHPGRTDFNGGHTCRTNCEKWGLKYDEYHFHNSVKDVVKPAKTQSKIYSK